ncbi:TPR repeat protein [Variovorax paradoxus]|uniref:tetratricopeptide repeat protein n=1 Tax=Variovorax paradoxus TaxID=34073 RepID=UPI00278D8ABD|nr:tetratricopeptide repeat protein [Variovorax paradoxus]MDQ0571068.1 TPR repeat protein [Variovorax paradoxus]
MAAMTAYDEDRNEEALRLMESCAENGDPVACYVAALWYRNGEGTPVDLKRSDELMQQLELLAESGNAVAQWEVGQHYRFADLLPLNIKRANYWLEAAAQNGHGDAQHHLAWYLATGQYNYSVDPETSEKWYLRAFEQGHPETLYTFALREFRNGEITEEAIALLKQAADKGFKQAEQVLRQYTH